METALTDRTETIAVCLFQCSGYETTPWRDVPQSIRDVWLAEAKNFEKRLAEHRMAIKAV